MPGPTPLNDELKELINLFLSHRVEFLVVGAHALAFYSVPRFTQDIDLLLNRTPENARRVRLALNEFGIGVTEEAEAQLVEKPRGMIVLGQRPNRVDLLNFLDGVDFDGAWARRVAGQLGDVPAHFTSLRDYISTKRATARAQDIDDLKRLRESLGPDYPSD